ncbi:MAG: 5-formyltetrahydrofolate cyclo-ligase [Polyangiaceae bacterium]
MRDPRDDGHSHALAPDDVIRRKVKAELRKRFRGLRKTTPASSCLERSEKIVRALLEHPAVAAASSVALFWPIEQRHEVDLRSLDATLRARGVALGYPAIDGEAGVMTFRRVDDTAALAEAGLGFAEPAPGSPELAPLDVVVVPALAIDPRGHRVGYGAGWYDRTLGRYAPPACTIAVAFDWQLVVEVPTVETDRAVDWIVTDARVLRASPDGAPPSDA